MANLEDLLRSKQRQIDELSAQKGDLNHDLEKQLREKEEELEIFKAGMDQLLLDLNKNKDTAKDDAMFDTLLLEHLKRLSDIIDSVLLSGVQRIDDALYELESPMNAGNQNATAGYLLSQIEKAAMSATEFATSFNSFVADGPSSHQAQIIKSVTTFSSAIADVLFNTKGITRFIPDERKADQLVDTARDAADLAVKYFQGVQSFRLDGLDADQKININISNNMDVQAGLQKLTKLVEQYVGKSTKLSDVNKDIGEHVDNELSKAAQAIDAAAARLAQLMNKSKEGYSTYELQVHESILNSAIAITNAIAQLIKAATLSQQEIVAKGKGARSRTDFYKKNNRWTEGLISAAKAVAGSTNLLIETADGVISGRNKLEQMYD